jgi:hypothetical protein
LDLNFLTNKLFSGARWSFTESLQDFPATIYSLVIIFKLGINAPITLTGIADGDNFNFSKPSNETTLLVNGDYNYQVVATSLTDPLDITVIAGGSVHIYPLLSSSADQRTRWEKRLEALEAAYDNWCDNEANEVEVPGKGRVVYRDLAKLVHDIAVARLWVQKEKDEEAGKGGPNNFYGQFSR